MTEGSSSGKVRKLEIPVETGSGVPLYRQIADFVWVEVASGALDVGDRLPTVRQLAIDLGVHPKTVTRAYNELESLGVLIQRPGEGTFVGLHPADHQQLEDRKQLEGICRNAVSQALAAGFSFDDLLDALAELRPVISDRPRVP